MAVVTAVTNITVSSASQWRIKWIIRHSKGLWTLCSSLGNRSGSHLVLESGEQWFPDDRTVFDSFGAGSLGQCHFFDCFLNSDVQWNYVSSTVATPRKNPFGLHLNSVKHDCACCRKWANAEPHRRYRHEMLDVRYFSQHMTHSCV